MKINPDPSITLSSDARGPLIQWVGVQWQGGFYALVLSGIKAVIKTSPLRQSHLHSGLDIEIHDGAPVFMRPFELCYELASPAPIGLDGEEFDWALIVNVPNTSNLGCRVQQVVGPFWDELKSVSVRHDGHDWLLVQPRGLFNA